MITVQNVRWAMGHDWFVKVFVVDHGGEVSRVIAVRPDGISEQHLFTDFEELYKWAGY